MGKICDYANLVDEEAGLYLCNKYKTYCYFDEPNKKRCIEIYGSDYNGNDETLEDDIYDEDDSNEDCI